MDALLEQRIQYFERLLSSKNRSPIVVQLASLYLDAGRPHDALRYCDSAIAHFPYYTTAHLVRAKVLAALEMKAEARRELEFVHGVLPDVESIARMLKSIPASETETFEETPESGTPTHQVDETSTEAVESPEAEGESEESLAQEEEIVEAPEGADLATVSESHDESAEDMGENGGEGGQSETPSGVDAFGLSTEAGPDLTKETAAPSEEAPDFETESAELSNEAPEARQELEVAGEEAFRVGAGEDSSSGGDDFDAFAEQMHAELSGTENSLTMEQYLNAPLQAEENAEPDAIQELAEKLKNPKRITPIIDITEKKAPPPSEEDMPASTGFVTPTLAEIYAKQGWYDDAIVAYKTLARIKPAERERFERRIKELEDLKKSQEEGGS